MAGVVEQVPLHQAAAERYLSYALSVISSRALPDVRDGLKPVQRRILYTMHVEMNLAPSGRYHKCAAVVGEVMGKYHPHGDSSIYEALVRMAQPWSLLAPLVDGQGNFGSLDGDPPAAMRYTECKLRPMAVELLSEIKKRTVDFRPSYDGQRFEPVVLPAQLPHLLVNGSEGIAVGMATRIPPHNLAEVVDAAVALIDDRTIGVRELLQHVQGPDFPTGGHVLATPDELLRLYEAGQGTLKVRATWETDKDGRRRQVVVTSIPYGTNKAKIVEDMGAHVRDKKLPQVVDVRDESTDDVRIVLELKQDASPEQVMAYLFKHTQLQASWPVNLTALVPNVRDDDTVSEVPTPARLDLKSMLVYWLDFRFETVRRRYEYDLAQLRDRIHLLEGFAKIFDALDEAIAIIRGSEGKRDAAEKLISRFDLSDLQADAILELRLYKLARLEILAILEELAELRAEADRLERLLASDKKLWKEVRKELLEIRKAYAEERRTTVGVPRVDVSYDEDAYIVKEDAYCVVTREGWIKRQNSFSDLSKIRVRDGDEVGWLIKAHTRSTLTVFTNHGSAYVVRVGDIDATTGYGSPLQASFSFADGEKVVGVVSHDARHRPLLQESLPLDTGDDPPPPYGVAMTRQGRALRFPLKPHEELSTRAGRKYARLNDGDEVFVALPQRTEEDRVCLASTGGRATVFLASEIPILKAAGKGVTGLKLKEDDEIMCFELAEGPMEGPVVVTSFGRELEVRERKFGLNKRGARGKVVLQRGSIETWKREPIVMTGDPPKPAPTPREPSVVADDAAPVRAAADGEE
ncbi:MAG: DNA topoisomerase IV subunit A [Alphaproteobacteria bacterium]|nr:DNA topoisomerase IV subunit A [Alphaproteobacteria bacterium]